MAETIACAALVAFTRFVSGHGIVHGDPDNKDAKKPNVPVEKIVEWHDEGLIKAPKAFLSEVKAEAEQVADADLAARQAAADAAADAADEDGAPI